MDELQMAKPRRINKLFWIVIPFVLAAVVVTGAISMHNTHAAPAGSPLNGEYNFRGITTSGPNTGLYLTGALSIAVNGNQITGSICSLKIAEQRCTSVTGTTPDNLHVQITVSHLKGFRLLTLIGVYQATQGQHGGFDGFTGTFTLDGSSGTWQARVGSDPPLDGSWNLFGVVNSGPDTGEQIHGVLTLSQNQYGRLTGTFCPNGGPCQPVTGGNNKYNYFHFDISVFGKVLQLSGVFVGGYSSRISGQFLSLHTNPSQTDKGYWLGH